MKLGRLAKRAFDIAASGAGLVLLAPAMGVIAAAIRVDSAGSVLFAQDRIGQNGKVFRLLKFRTMRDAPIVYNPDGSTMVAENDPRVTTVGRFLRGGLDELPQLINVLRGEMSLVGPRPEMASQRWMYEPGHEKKLEVRPGLTSLAIIEGRTTIEWRDRVAIDLKYVEHWTFCLDAKIILQTLMLPLGLRPFDFSAVLGKG